ncbi:MAG: DUF2178 domain-containing protein [Patescibacteria group bacterium]
MQYKRYRSLKIGLVMLLAATVGGFVSQGNFVIPLVAFAIAAGTIFLVSRHVDSVQNDERIEKIGGKAARWILAIFAIGGAIASIVLTALAKDNPIYQIPAYIFSGLVWFVLVGHLVLFYYFNRKGE